MFPEITLTKPQTTSEHEFPSVAEHEPASVHTTGGPIRKSASNLHLKSNRNSPYDRSPIRVKESHISSGHLLKVPVPSNQLATGERPFDSKKTTEDELVGQMNGIQF